MSLALGTRAFNATWNEGVKDSGAVATKDHLQFLFQMFPALGAQAFATWGEGTADSGAAATWSEGVVHEQIHLSSAHGF